jgi:hypothetical protein
MSVFTPIRIDSNHKVRNLDYLRTENKPAEESPKPTEPANPQHPEAS